MPSPLSQQISQLPKGLITRFAPSPTGHLHLGHIASAIHVWGVAAACEAQIVLRIEDHDRARCRPEYLDSILADLDWLGFHPHRQGPGFQQSLHEGRYEKALAQLSSSLYRCSCSRREILARSPAVQGELHYDGHCRSINNGDSVRLLIERSPQTFRDLLLGEQVQVPSEQCGDLLVRDRDGFWTYNFAVTIDDLVDEVDLVIRGQDLLSATGRQLQLRHKLDDEAKSLHFLHHPLIMEADASKKLSKRDGSYSIAQWRQQGLAPEQLIGKAAFQVGIIKEEKPLAVAELKELFL